MPLTSTSNIKQWASAFLQFLSRHGIQPLVELCNMFLLFSMFLLVIVMISDVLILLLVVVEQRFRASWVEDGWRRVDEAVRNQWKGCRVSSLGREDRNCNLNFTKVYVFLLFPIAVESRRICLKKGIRIGFDQVVHSTILRVKVDSESQYDSSVLSVEHKSRKGR